LERLRRGVMSVVPGLEQARYSMTHSHRSPKTTS
jgi:hypothetical protein